MFLKRSEVPVTAQGRTSTEPRLRISEIGQVVFNKLATEKLLTSAAIGKDLVHEIYLDWTDRKLSFTLKLPKGMKEGDGFPAKVGKKSDLINFSGAGLFKHIGYDFQKSGAQVLRITTNGSGLMSIHLPEYLEPVAKTERKPRKKKDSGTAKAAPVPEAELTMV